jgi:hypothetical protein
VGSEGVLTGALAASTGMVLVGAPPKTNNLAESEGQDSACGRRAGPAILGAGALEPGRATFTGADPRDCAVAAECFEAGECQDEPVRVLT